MSWKMVCVPCRKVYSAGRATSRHTPESRIPVHAPKNCTHCRQPMVGLPYRWRPPKRRNDRAWRRIEAGHWLWENDPKDKRPVWRDQWSPEQKRRDKSLTPPAWLTPLLNWRNR